jgi:hypothetical protein
MGVAILFDDTACGFPTWGPSVILPLLGCSLEFVAALSGTELLLESSGAPKLGFCGVVGVVLKVEVGVPNTDLSGDTFASLSEDPSGLRGGPNGEEGLSCLNGVDGGPRLKGEKSSTLRELEGKGDVDCLPGTAPNGEEFCLGLEPNGDVDCLVPNGA